jgi:hypothetical protein
MMRGDDSSSMHPIQPLFLLVCHLASISVSVCLFLFFETLQPILSLSLFPSFIAAHPPTPAGGRGVTYAEFADGMRALAAATGSQDAALGISDRRLQRLLRHLDADADGLINYEDFARVWRLEVKMEMGMREIELSNGVDV